MFALRYFLPVLLLTPLAAHADSIYNFDSTPSGSSLPLTLTDSGLTASFSGTGITLDGTGYLSALSGTTLAEYASPGQPIAPLTVGFSGGLSSLSFNFAVQQSDTLIVSLFNAGTDVGDYQFGSAVPAGYYYPEGLAAVAGSFDSISVTTASGSAFAVDNFDAVATTPEPSSLLLLGTGLAGVAGSLRRRAFRRS